MTVTNVTSPTRGLVGYLHELEYDKDSVLIFQLPRKTEMLSNTYVKSALDALREVMPNKKAIVIGADVNVYSIAGEEATALVLKGII